jgi:hypothetical protein
MVRANGFQEAAGWLPQAKVGSFRAFAKQDDLLVPVCIEKVHRRR